MFIILICITVAIISVTWVVYENYVEEHVPVLSLSIKVTDGGLDTEFNRWDSATMQHLPYIQNISSDVVLEQGTVSAAEVQGDTPMNLPGVFARAFDSDTGDALSYWASAKYEGSGTYDLTLFFFEPPVNGDSIKIILEINDEHGDDMFPYYNEDLANSSILYVWE